jgi:hypothetical protein
MRRSLRVLLIIISLVAAYSACQRASEENTGDSSLVVLEADSIQNAYNEKLSYVDAAWTTYQTEEEEKLTDLKRLLQEISYTESYNQERYDTLMQAVERIQNNMLDASAMTSRQIDQFDSAVSSLQSAVIDFAMTHPDFEKYPMMSHLVDSVGTRDQRILFHRVKYDDYARDYNNFLLPARQYVPELSEAEINERPLFQLED